MSSVPPDTGSVPSGRGSSRPGRPASLARRIGVGVLMILLVTITAYALMAVTATRTLVNDAASRETGEAWNRAEAQLSATDAGADSASDDVAHVPGTLGQPEGTVVALVASADVEDHRPDALRGHRVGVAGEPERLDTQEAHEILHAILEYRVGRRVDATLGGVAYRFEVGPVTAPGPWVGPDRVLVVGVPTVGLADVARRALLTVVIGVIATVLLTTLLVYLWLRRGLAPLGEVAAVAERLAGVDMAQSGLDLTPLRVPRRLLEGPGEVAVVADALDRFTGSVESALEARRNDEQSLRGFMADASHELRTPLASVRGYAEMIAMTEDLSDTGRRSLDRVLHQADRMAALVDDMLLLERLESVSRGRALGLEPSGEVPAAEPVDLSEVVLEAVVDARAAWPGHTWVLDLPVGAAPGSLPCVTGDRAQLTRVVGNLLSNAAKHTPAGTTVTASVRMNRPRPNHMLVSVHDDGGGIPAESRERLFERFARGPADHPGGEPSTGLGLAIVRSIARSHGGDVTVESAAGWTRFDVVVPCQSPGGGGAPGPCCEP